MVKVDKVVCTHYQSIHLHAILTKRLAFLFSMFYNKLQTILSMNATKYTLKTENL